MAPGVIGYQKALHRIRALTSEEHPKFLYYTLYWAANTGVFNVGGISTIAHLTGEQLRRYRFPTPPIPEQRAISDYLDHETAKISFLMKKIEDAIERLHEYRTALITAAVTGKIDVRGLGVRDQAKPDDLHLKSGPH
jgi:type I restriction enzyme S subunit